MNCGAKVPAGVLLRFELARRRVESLRPSSGLLSWLRDWLRTCVMAWDGWSASGDETRADLGLGASGAGTAACEGEEEFLAKGLFRHRGPVGAGALMAVLICGCWGRCDGGYLAASARRMVFRGEKKHVKKRRANAGPEAQLLLCTTVRRPGVERRRWVQLRGDGGMRGVCLRRAALEPPQEVVPGPINHPSRSDLGHAAHLPPERVTHRTHPPPPPPPPPGRLLCRRELSHSSASLQHHHPPARAPPSIQHPAPNPIAISPAAVQQQPPCPPPSPGTCASPNRFHPPPPSPIAAHTT